IRAGLLTLRIPRIADGPGFVRPGGGHALQAVVVPPLVGRGDNAPADPVPVEHQRLGVAQWIVAAHGPDISGTIRRDSGELIAPDTDGEAGHDRPGAAVPVLE